MVGFVSLVSEIGNRARDSGHWHARSRVKHPVRISKVGSVKVNVRLSAAPSYCRREVYSVRPKIPDPPQLGGRRVRDHRFYGELWVTGALGGHEIRVHSQPVCLDLELSRERGACGCVHSVPDAGDDLPHGQTAQ